MQDTKIYLVLCKDEKGHDIVSHGVGNITLRDHILPCEPVASFNPKKDAEGWFVDGPAARKMPLRLMVRDQGKWATSETPVGAKDLRRCLSSLDGTEAVVIDDAKGVYYCGQVGLLSAYLAKGKKAELFCVLDRQLFVEGLEAKRSI